MSEIKEHPWLAKAEVVRAILRGHQTQDRRPFLAADAIDYFVNCDGVRAKFFKDGESFYKALPWQPGTHIWVREAWAEGWTYGGGTPAVFYRADGVGLVGSAQYPVVEVARGAFGIVSGKPACSAPDSIKWRPSIHMPRWASRITLLVKRVWVERLQNVGEDGAKAEGFRYQGGCSGCGSCGGGLDCQDSPLEQFIALWDTCYPNPALQWNANPWVIATEFERITP